MFEIVLWQPEIPQNTGNLMRLTVNTGCRLHLIEPLGFSLDEARLRRAGLDYREHATVTTHPSYERWHDHWAAASGSGRVFAFSQHASTRYTDVGFRAGDTMLFGRESDGLPEAILDHPSVTERLRIPIATGGRSLNLANAAAVAIYEGWRQLGFASPERAGLPDERQPGSV